MWPDDPPLPKCKPRSTKIAPYENRNRQASISIAWREAPVILFLAGPLTVQSLAGRAPARQARSRRSGEPVLAAVIMGKPRRASADATLAALPDLIWRRPTP